MTKFQALTLLSLILRSLAGAMLLLFPSISAANELREVVARFQILGPEGTPIGWQIEQISRNSEEWIISRERRMSFTVDGHEPIDTRIVMHRSVKSDGQPAVLTIESKIDGSEYEFRVVFGETSATITRTSRGERKSWTSAFPQDARLSDPDSLIDLPVGDYFVFDPSISAFTKMTASREAMEQNGTTADFRFSNGLPIEVWLHQIGTDGAIRSSVRPLLGSPISFERIDTERALPSLNGRGQINHQMVPSPFSASNSARFGKIRYRFGLPDTLVPLIPQTGEQSVTPSPGAVTVNICQTCGGQISDKADDLARWILPTNWLQSDSPPFKRRGERMAKSDKSDSEKMHALGRIARLRLSKVNLNGHSSALAAWKNRSGDCTEDAVVLAALARAAGIPALVASGIVYTRERYHGAANAFVPHSWVVAYVGGQWRSFDITLEGFDTTHIALSLGEGDPRSIAAATQIAGLLEWNEMAEIRARPASSGN